MKKKIFGFLILVILAIISTVKVNFTEDTTGSFMLANIEALAANAKEGVEDCDIFYIIEMKQKQVELLKSSLREDLNFLYRGMEKRLV